MPFILAILAYSAGCNSSDNSTPASESQTFKTANDSGAHKLSGPLNSKFLDELFIDTATFSVLNDNGKKKVTFRFHITDLDSLTLRAWVNGNGQNNYPGTDTTAKFIMHNGAKSGITLDDGADLGNLVISGGDVNKILKKATEKKCRFVLFRPLDPDLNGGQVMYDILVTDKDPKTLAPDDKMLTSPTNLTTNPSPPKNSNG